MVQKYVETTITWLESGGNNLFCEISLLGHKVSGFDCFLLRSVLLMIRRFSR